MTDPVALRARLVELRRSLLDEMGRDGPAAGAMALLAGINAALAALDAEADTLDGAEPACRAVLIDGSEAIKLALYTEAGQAVVRELSPQRAVQLAGQMIAAASRRWQA
jgi:hypothetical protein